MTPWSVCLWPFLSVCGGRRGLSNPWHQIALYCLIIQHPPECTFPPTWAQSSLTKYRNVCVCVSGTCCTTGKVPSCGIQCESRVNSRAIQWGLLFKTRKCRQTDISSSLFEKGFWLWEKLVPVPWSLERLGFLSVASECCIHSLWHHTTCKPNSCV